MNAAPIDDSVRATLTDDVISQETQPVDRVVVVIFIFILVDWEGDLHLHAPAKIKPDQLSVN